MNATANATDVIAQIKAELTRLNCLFTPDPARPDDYDQRCHDGSFEVIEEGENLPAGWVILDWCSDIRAGRAEDVLAALKATNPEDSSVYGDPDFGDCAGWDAAMSTLKKFSEVDDGLVILPDTKFAQITLVERATGKRFHPHRHPLRPGQTAEQLHDYLRSIVLYNTETMEPRPMYSPAHEILVELDA